MISYLQNKSGFLGSDLVAPRTRQNHCQTSDHRIHRQNRQYSLGFRRRPSRNRRAKVRASIPYHRAGEQATKCRIPRKIFLLHHPQIRVRLGYTHSTATLT